jgi:hypothetical protein
MRGRALEALRRCSSCRSSSCFQCTGAPNRAAPERCALLTPTFLAAGSLPKSWMILPARVIGGAGCGRVLSAATEASLLRIAAERPYPATYVRVLAATSVDGERKASKARAKASATSWLSTRITLSAIRDPGGRSDPRAHRGRRSRASSKDANSKTRVVARALLRRSLRMLDPAERKVAVSRAARRALSRRSGTTGAAEIDPKGAQCPASMPIRGVRRG